MEVGVRVVRGPDWDLEDDECDGGEGFVGTVVEVGAKSSILPEKLVWVQWDSGIRHDHRAGYHGAYDLYVLDCSTIGIRHPGTRCQYCNETPIFGIRWDCLDCTDICSLCTTCYMGDEHEKSHNFKRIDAQGGNGVAVGKRAGIPKIQAKGIFPGAKVVRGPNWNLGEQDGGEGNIGVVLKITSWQSIPKSGVVVSWDHGEKTSCRRGVNGKVDLKYVYPGAGGFYYKSHLPKLGENYSSHQTKRFIDGPKIHGEKRRNDRPLFTQIIPTNHDKTEVLGKPVPLLGIPDSGQQGQKAQSVSGNKTRSGLSMSRAKSSEFKRGEVVSVILDKDVVKVMNEGYDEWRDEMQEYIGKEGTFHSISKNGGVNIVYPDTALWTFHPDLVTKVGQHCSTTEPASRKAHNGEIQLKRNDWVKILEDKEAVKQLQQSYGPWDDTVCKVLGRIGRILDVNSEGSIDVIVGSPGDENVITFNPAVLSKTDDNEETVRPKPDIAPYTDPQEIEYQTKAAAVLGGAAASGDLRVMTAVLDRYPGVIDHLDSGGHTALHNSCHHGQFDVVAFLLGKGSNMELKDWQGYTALHHASFGDKSGETASCLVLQGAVLDDNKNDLGSTPLHIAIKEYNTEAAKRLIQAGCDVNLQERTGFTALDLALFHDNVDVVKSLLKREDLILDVAGSQPFCRAMSRKACPETVKEIIRHFPDTASETLEDDMTPLHFAALYDNVRLAKFLLEEGNCDLDLKNKEGLTPIKLAHIAGSEHVLEVLPGYTHERESSRNIDQSLLLAVRLEFSKMAMDSQKVVKRPNSDRELKFGDKVQVLGNRALVKAYQIGNGGWANDMQSVLSKYGHVEEVLDNGCVRVAFQDPAFLGPLIFNPMCLDPVEEDDQENNNYEAINYCMPNSVSSWSGNESVDSLMKDFFVNKRLEGFLVSFDSSEVDRLRDDELYRAFMYVAVAMGCSTKIERIITLCPQALIPLENVPPPLHMSCINGDFEVAELLLDKGADVTEKEESGKFTPLHCVALGDNTGKVTDMLLKQGADVNENINSFLATPLHWAVAYGNDAVASRLIQSPGCDFTLTDNQGDTSLSRAVYAGRESIVGLMLALGKFDLKRCNEQGFNPLHVAAMEGNEKVVEMLLDHGSQSLINSRTRDGHSQTPLHLACYKGHAGVARVLFKKGCNFHLQNANGHTSLTVASSISRQDAAIAVVVKMYGSRATEHAAPSDVVNAEKLEEYAHIFRPGDVVKVHSNREVLSSLHQEMSVQKIVQFLGREGRVLTTDDERNVKVVFEGDKETCTFNRWALSCIRRLNPASPVVRCQEDQGPKSSVIDTIERMVKGEHEWSSELIKVVCTSHMSKLKSIIQKNPDVVRNKVRDTTLLHLAARNGARGIMKELLNNQADCDAQDSKRCTPLHVAAAKERTGSAAELLLEKGADPNIQGFEDFKRSPLHLAVCRNNQAAVKALTRNKKCNVNLQDSYGDSPLHCAIDQEKEGMVELLIASKDCNPRLPNRENYNALHLAAVRRNERVFGIVLKKYPDIVNEVDVRGNTALHLAAEKGSIEIVQILLEEANCNIDLTNRNNKTALDLATLNGHVQVQQLFPGYEEQFRPLEGQFLMGACQSSSKASLYVDNDNLLENSNDPLNYRDLNGDSGCVPYMVSTQPRMQKLKPEVERPTDSKDKLPTQESAHEFHASWFNVGKSTTKHIESSQRSKGFLLKKENQQHTSGDEGAIAEPSTSPIEQEDICGSCRNAAAEVRFLPCKHKIMCESCSFRVKKCVKCHHSVAEKVLEGYIQEEFSNSKKQDSVKGKKKGSSQMQKRHAASDLPAHPIFATEKGRQVVDTKQVDLPAPARCVMCDRSRATVRFRPCEHKITCEDCSFAVKKCVACFRSVAEKVSEHPTPK